MLEALYVAGGNSQAFRRNIRAGHGRASGRGDPRVRRRGAYARARDTRPRRARPRRGGRAREDSPGDRRADRRLQRGRASAQVVSGGW